MPRTKTDMVVVMAKAGGVPEKASERMLDALVSGITEAVVAGERVAVTGLGGFSRSERKARRGRDLRSGEALVIPACRVVKFSAARSLREKLNPPAAESGTGPASPEVPAAPEADPVEPVRGRILPPASPVRPRPAKQPPPAAGATKA